MNSLRIYGVSTLSATVLIPVHQSETGDKIGSFDTVINTSSPFLLRSLERPDASLAALI